MQKIKIMLYISYISLHITHSYMHLYIYTFPYIYVNVVLYKRLSAVFCPIV